MNPAILVLSAGTLVYAAGLPPRIDNPNLRGNGWNEATALVYSRLYRVGLSGRIEPDLVAHEEISGDGMTWTLHLRENVAWHDGARFTSRDVKATLDRVFDPSAECDLDLNLPMIDSFEAPDEKRIVLKLRRPAPLLAAPLSEIAILPAGVAPAPPGTGPFRLSATRDDGTLELTAHGAFHLGAPLTGTIRMKHIPDAAARAAAVGRGEVDIAHISPQQAGSIAPPARVVRMTTGAWRGMPLNLRRPALADVRVRRAIDLALDREAILAEALPGGGAPAYQHLPPASFAFAPELDRPYRDVARARSLLREAGWGAGRTLTLRLIVWKDEPFRVAAAGVIARQLKEIGIQVEQAMVDHADYSRLAEAMGTEYDGFIGGWGALLDPGDNLYKKFHSRGSQNHMGLSDPRIDMLLEAAMAETSPDAARPHYRALLAALREMAVFLPLVYPDYLYAVSPRVTGVEPAVVDSWYEFTRNAHQWGIAVRSAPGDGPPGDGRRSAPPRPRARPAPPAAGGSTAARG